MKKQKSLTNKGFSLVELIIVVAIMAILIAILAPQYLRYVERTRIQKDNTAIDEVVNAVKVAAADEDIIEEVAKGATIAFSSTGTTLTGADVDSLTAEVVATVGPLADIKLTSNTYRNITGGTTNGTVTVTVTVTNNIVTFTADQWVEKVGGTPIANKTF